MKKKKSKQPVQKPPDGENLRVSNPDRDICPLPSPYRDMRFFLPPEHPLTPDEIEAELAKHDPLWEALESADEDEDEPRKH